MQRADLPPPISLLEPYDRSSSAVGEAAVSAPGWHGTRGRLDPPGEARERRRPLFHPARGWIRRTERATSHFLTRFVFPWVPGIGIPYSGLLGRQLVLSEATIALAGLPAAFERMRILLITDIHAGPFVDPPTLDELFERLCRLEPDLILIGGDVSSSSIREIDRSRAAFERLAAPLGVWAVLGNHDHYTGRPAAVIERLASYGIRTLSNRSVALLRDGERLSLAGVDDLLMGKADLDAALDDAVPPVVLLSHNPDLLFAAARRGVALMLSGHTHAGQIRLPGLGVLVRQSRFRLDQGRYRFRQTELVVSRGVGAVGIPWRVQCPPEVVLLTLGRQPSS
ncbi:MAG TPA: metallophosphoesterase [Candidatus Polarisedimenticolaceae bacterium]|nr:metallophosphoesterase [Candidatus Polarisedimenticolaceae bacterium]